jgi:general secretion pathway protein A
MYLDYWGFKLPPFENVPDRHVFFRSSQHEEALVRLLYAVEHRKGAAMLTGEVGSGKTTISRVLKDALPEDRYSVKTIVNPALNPLDLIRAILFSLGDVSDSDSKFVLLTRLHDRLSRNSDQGLNTILVIDEAHLIKNSSSLEELRMLLNMQNEHQFLITLLILGQPPLLENISAMHPLKERISIKYNLKPLDLKDSVRYILFRLKNAGADRGIFTKEAMFPLFDYSRGIPLRINNLCDRSLLIGLLRRARGVDTRIVNEAIEDLQ